MFRGLTPNASTPVSNTELAHLIGWGDAILEGDFQAIGYKIPFQEISGETWPVNQTTLLEMMSSVAAIALGTGYLLAPAPAMTIGRVQGERNPFWVMIDRFRQAISDHGFRFRAQFYLGTKAEKLLSDPHGPRTDWMEDLYDPTRYQGLRKYTDFIAEAFKDIQDYDIDYDYMYSFRTAE
jgi:hypothetical protein